MVRVLQLRPTFVKKIDIRFLFFINMGDENVFICKMSHTSISFVAKLPR